MEVLGLLLDHGADPTLQVAVGLRGTISWAWICGRIFTFGYASQRWEDNLGRREYPATTCSQCLSSNV